jgi:hypothetical protein
MRYMVVSLVMAVAIAITTSAASACGAVAMAPDGEYGAASGWETCSEAENAAYQACARKTDLVCNVMDYNDNAWIIGMHCVDGSSQRSFVVENRSLSVALANMKSKTSGHGSCSLVIKIHSENGR